MEENDLIKNDLFEKILLDPSDIIDTVISDSFKLLEKKYGNEFIKMITPLKDTTFKSNTLYKMFVLLFMINKDEEIKNIFYDSIDTDRIQRFIHVLKVLSDMCEKTLEFPYNQTNVVDIVRNFVLNVQREYITGYGER